MNKDLAEIDEVFDHLEAAQSVADLDVRLQSARVRRRIKEWETSRPAAVVAVDDYAKTIRSRLLATTKRK